MQNTDDEIRNASSWRLMDHTADMGIELKSPSPEGLFCVAAAAFASLITDETQGAKSCRDIDAEGIDIGELLVRFLNELAYIASVEKSAPVACDVKSLSSNKITASVTFQKMADVKTEIKAATYHGLEFKRINGAWTARIILDV